jgi:Luciferase-like monooxygenase
MGPRWTHSLSASGFFLGATKRIVLAPLVVVPCHDPIELAKSISTLDYMSGGRIIPVALAGYQRWEFELLQRPPFEERGAVMDEYLAAMIELWTSDSPRFDGRYVRLDDVVFDPKPVQQPMPIWIGGDTPPALRRLARFGSGWFPQMTWRAQFRERIDYVRSQPEFQANPRPLDVMMHLFEGERNQVTHELMAPPRIAFDKDLILEQIHELAALGATTTLVSDVVGTGIYQDVEGAHPPRDLGEALERLQWFAQEVLPEAHRIVPSPAAA